jgi:hypothetical protein
MPNMPVFRTNISPSIFFQLKFCLGNLILSSKGGIKKGFFLTEQNFWTKAVATK